jgi:hypothetical protein
MPVSVVFHSDSLILVIGERKRQWWAIKSGMKGAIFNGFFS